MAEAFLVVVLMATIAPWDVWPPWARRLGSIGLGEVTILASYALGCNVVDALVTYNILLAIRFLIWWRKVRDLKHSAVSLRQQKNVEAESDC